MTHESRHEVIRNEICDWMEVNVKMKKKRKKKNVVLLCDELKQGASVLPAQSEQEGGQRG